MQGGGTGWHFELYPAKILINKHVIHHLMFDFIHNLQLPLDWNAVQGASLPEVDVVLGADIFYSSEGMSTSICAEVSVFLIGKFHEANRTNPNNAI